MDDRIELKELKREVEEADLDSFGGAGLSLADAEDMLDAAGGCEGGEDVGLEGKGGKIG